MTSPADLQALRDEFADFRAAVTAELADIRRTIVGSSDAVNEANQPLYDALVEWRRAEATRQGVEAYRIFSNRLLAAITAVQPKDKFELVRIKGIGEDKTIRYADDVLAIVASHSW